MQQTIYLYNANGEYTGTGIAYSTSLPHSSTFKAPPPYGEKEIPVFKDDEWTIVEDHRKKFDDRGREIEGSGTPYWLLDDKYGASARYMETSGSLPQNSTLIAPERTLEDAQEYAYAQLKAYRQQVESSGFMYNGQKWDSEEKDELRFHSANRMFEKGLTVWEDWKVQDGIYVDLTPEMLNEVEYAMAQHLDKCFNVEKTKRTEIDALTTSSEIEDWIETSMKEGWN